MSKLDILIEKYPHVKDLYFECGEGWADILEPVIKAINDYNATSDEPVRVAQIKEKWGSLRISTDGHPDEIDEVIDTAERLSVTTCEVCGEPGILRTGGWLVTRCDLHHK